MGNDISQPNHNLILITFQTRWLFHLEGPERFQKARGLNFPCKATSDH